MGSPAFKLTAGFSLGYFRRLAESVEPNFSRIKSSSLTGLLKAVERLPEGYLAFTPQQKDQIQELIFLLPYDKQQKYKAALAHLATAAKVKVCGRPTEPTMNLAYFAVGVYAYPANGQTITLNPGSFHHVFRFGWKSSTGNLQSLKDVGTREFVTFRSAPGGPPFNYTQSAIPMQYTHGETLSGSQFGQCLDDHSTKNPSVISANPRVAGELVAEQWYQYTVDNGATWKNIPGAAFLLIKGVRMRGTQPVYYFAKTNWAPHNTKAFHFEVEYNIDPAPAAMPAPGKLDMQSGNPAPLEQYATKIISKGSNYLYNP